MGEGHRWRYYCCPNTGRAFACSEADDKALCECGRPNPAIRGEEAKSGWVEHFVADLRKTTFEEYLAQRIADWEPDDRESWGKPSFPERETDEENGAPDLSFVKWRPIEDLDNILALLREAVRDAWKQLEASRQVQPGEVEESIRKATRIGCAEGRVINELLHEQLARWRQLRLSADQEQKLNEAEALLRADNRLFQKILETAERWVTSEQMGCDQDGAV